MRELNIKLIDMAHANADAVFDLAHEIASVQAPFDLVAIWSAHAKRQSEMMTKQTRELTEVGQKLASRNRSPQGLCLSTSSVCMEQTSRLRYLFGSAALGPQ